MQLLQKYCLIVRNFPFQKFKPQPIKIEPKDLNHYLELFYPKPSVKTMNQKKKYVCATCKSNFDLFGLYSHMKKVNNWSYD
jgi:hypothetical protein